MKPKAEDKAISEARDFRQERKKEVYIGFKCTPLMKAQMHYLVYGAEIFGRDASVTKPLRDYAEKLIQDNYDLLPENLKN